MNKPIVTNSENRQPKRVDVYEEFVLWSAMPPSERFKLGIETQEQFVEFYKIGINTPAAWKRRPDYEARVTAIRKEWAFGKTSAVIEGIYRSALKGNPASQKLWLQYFHNFSEKQEVKHVAKTEVGVNDVRFLIDGLPEPHRTKFHGYLREIVDTTCALRHARQLDANKMNEHMPEDYVYYHNDTLELGPSAKRPEPLIQEHRMSRGCDPYATCRKAVADHRSVMAPNDRWLSIAAAEA